MRRPAILAVDGGGSKLDAVFLRRDGTVLGVARVKPSMWDGSDEHLDDVERAIRAAARDAALDVDRRPLAEIGVFCLAGADLPSDERRIARGLRKRGLSDHDVVRNDTFAVLRAGTDRAWGVAVVCGYGTNCSAVSPDGRVTRFPAIGPISGDWGGASELGASAAWHAVRSEDGRGVKTSLEREVPAHFGLKRPRQLVEAIHHGRIDEGRLAELAPTLFRAAASGDAVARDLVDRQADEIVAMSTTAIRRLGMTKLDPDVVLGGGIFRNDDRSFFARIDAGVRAVAPRATARRLTAPPIVGAAQIGLDLAGASVGAKRRARLALTHDRITHHTRRRRDS